MDREIVRKTAKDGTGGECERMGKGQEWILFRNLTKSAHKFYDSKLQYDLISYRIFLCILPLVNLLW